MMGDHNRKKRVRARLSEAQNHRCCYCGVRMTDPSDGELPTMATLEHVQRQADGGWWSQANLVVACKDCNSQRMNCGARKWAQKRAGIAA